MPLGTVRSSIFFSAQTPCKKLLISALQQGLLLKALAKVQFESNSQPRAAG